MPEIPVWTQKLGHRINQVAISDDGLVAVGATYFFPPKTDTSNTKKTVGVFAYDQKGKNPLLADKFPATAAPATEGGPYSVAVSPDGKYVAACGLIDVNKGFLYIYEIVTGNPAGNRYDAFGANPPGERVNFVAIGKTGAGKYVVAVGADQLYVFVGTAGGWKMSTVPTKHSVEEVAVSKDGKWIVAAVEYGSVVLVSNADGTGQNLIASSPYSFVVGTADTRAMGVALASDSSGFAVAVTNTTAPTGSAVYFQTAGFTPSGALNPAWTTQLGGCTSCRWIDVSKTGKYVAAVGNVGTNQATDTGLLFLFDKSGNQVFVSKATDIPQSPNCVSIDDTGLNIVVSDGYVPHQQNAAFYFFSAAAPPDPTTEQLTWSFPDNIMNRSVAISANGKAMVGGADDGTLYYFTLP
jgi:WD40 repeat protein